ncbi:MAG: hypothetical protein ACP5N1_03975 [Candidatus Woesearchaeota archaeon]
MIEKNLSEYIQDIRKEYELLKNNLNFLEKITYPLDVICYSDKSISLQSEDYTLATDVKINKRSSIIQSSSNYDGGTYSYRNEYYPQFYFTLKNKPKNVQVNIRHVDFERDKNIIIRSYNVTIGTGDCKSNNNVESNHVDKKKAIEYFKEKGVKEELIIILEDKIKEYDNLIGFE